jgi:hypothetical protein
MTDRKAYIDNNRERIRETNRAWAAAHKDQSQAYYQNHKEEKREYRKAYNSTAKGRFANYKSGARVRKIPFELTFDEFETFWQAPCVYCGDLIDTIGVDRINNSLGYTIDNCVSCCQTCNYMKSDLCEDKWLSHMSKVLKHKGII